MVFDLLEEKRCYKDQLSRWAGFLGHTVMNLACTDIDPLYDAYVMIYRMPRKLAYYGSQVTYGFL